MSEKSSSPRIEDYLRRQAFERRAHVLTEKGSYQVHSSLGHAPFSGILGSHLPDYGENLTVMWVDFLKHRQTGLSPEGKPTTVSAQAGEIAIALGARDFSTVEEIMDQKLETEYMREWMQRYWPDGQSSSFVERTRPIITPVMLLRDYLKNR